MTLAAARTSMVPRIIPDVPFDVRRPHRLIERSFMVYRRSPMVIFSGFFEPLFYLLSMRVGLSSLIGDVEVGGRLIPYAEFVAPGLMASAAMNGAVFDSTMNVFHKWKHAELIVKKYHRLIYPRPGEGMDTSSELLNATLVNAPLMEISSSFIRKAIREGKDVRHLVPAKAFQYMREMHFYEK